MRLALIGVLLISRTIVFAQPKDPPDSILARVVILEKVAYFADREQPGRSFFPQGTGFYFDCGPSGQRYLVTARHVLYRSNMSFAIEIHAVGATGLARTIVLTDNPAAESVVRHPDDLVDMLLIGNSAQADSVDGGGLFPGFQPDDIVSEAELRSMRRGQKMLYIGRWPDSTDPNASTYRMPQGTLLKVPTEPLVLLDPIRHLTFKADFSLKIPGTPGVSGSPVLIKDDSGYRLVGIVNAFGIDAAGKMKSTAYCTAAYRILDALRNQAPLGER